MKNTFVLLICFVFILACKPNKALTKTDNLLPKTKRNISNEVAIKSVLMAQQTAWSDGDINAFMEGYWKSEELTFIGRSGINKGWQTTKDNYIKGYPDKATMGKLEFEVLELEKLSEVLYRMVGKYTLVREKDKPTGIFTLLWRFIDGEWLIIYDHTCG